jgi:hypothetical protein
MVKDLLFYGTVYEGKMFLNAALYQKTPASAFDTSTPSAASYINAYVEAYIKWGWDTFPAFAFISRLGQISRLFVLIFVLT